MDPKVQQTLEAFEYAGDDPVNATDRSGEAVGGGAVLDWFIYIIFYADGFPKYTGITSRSLGVRLDEHGDYIPKGETEPRFQPDQGDTAVVMNPDEPIRGTLYDAQSVEQVFIRVGETLGAWPNNRTLTFKSPAAARAAEDNGLDLVDQNNELRGRFLMFDDDVLAGVYANEPYLEGRGGEGGEGEGGEGGEGGGGGGGE